MRKAHALLGLMAMAAMSEPTTFGMGSEPLVFNRKPQLTFSSGAYKNRRYKGKKTNSTQKVIACRRKANKAARRSRNINHR
jgi:hypothetical protein